MSEKTAIDIIKAARQTHVGWADFFRANPYHQDEGIYKHVGNLKQHTNYINDYDKVIAELEEVELTDKLCPIGQTESCGYWAKQQKKIDRLQAELDRKK